MSELTPTVARPVAESERIQSLDVLRGFALLGILLLNIIGFGMLSAAYFSPLLDVGEGATRIANLAVWGTVELLFEGSMRGLFSILFGAGIVLFTTDRVRGGVLHYRRNAWLLVFGLIDAFVLLWTGDILTVYALAGFLLYPLRNLSPRRLTIIAGVLIAAMSLFHLAGHFGLSLARESAAALEALPPGEQPAPGLRENADAWFEFNRDFGSDPARHAAELRQRGSSYLSAARYTAAQMAQLYVFVVPVYLLWDAVAMMLLGMALFRSGALSASWQARQYVRLAAMGFAFGLLVNGYEVWRAVAHQFDILAVFPFMQWTYHLGRVGMAFGYLGVVMLICRSGVLTAVRSALADVGRMALTNYLAQSLLALVIFTGAGFGLVGELPRWALYVVVVAIWALQIVISRAWLARYRYGPVEWCWRALTYGVAPPMRRPD